MKRFKKLTNGLLSFLLLLFTFHSSAQSVGINAAGLSPDNSALLDLNSNNKGFLITRADTINIISPAFGLMTLAPTDSCLYLYNGMNWIGMGGGGSNCSCSCSDSGSVPQGPYCGPDKITKVVDVTSATGKIWMDRNLGADRVAISSSDANAYGSLYQWGRCHDGHESRSSNITSTISTTDDPGHSDFIKVFGDWRNPQNDILWQGATGINNPCPTGYRLPTKPELDNERMSWTSNDGAGAYSSPLKLPLAGYRADANGTFKEVGTNGLYWSSTVDNAFSQNLTIFPTNTIINGIRRGYGGSVRCIKD